MNNKEILEEFDKKFTRKSKGEKDLGEFRDDWFLKDGTTSRNVKKFIKEKLAEKNKEHIEMTKELVAKKNLNCKRYLEAKEKECEEKVSKLEQIRCDEMMAEKDKEFITILEKLKKKEMEWDINRSVGQDGFIRGFNKSVKELNNKIDEAKKL